MEAGSSRATLSLLMLSVMVLVLVKFLLTFFFIFFAAFDAELSLSVTGRLSLPIGEQSTAMLIGFK